MNKNFLLTRGDVQYIMDMQRELNAEYHGSDWRDKLKFGELMMCARFELLAEYLREIEGMWKFFGNCPINREKALFELVDYVSFFGSALALGSEQVPAFHNEQIEQLDSFERSTVIKQVEALHLMANPNFMGGVVMDESWSTTHAVLTLTAVVQVALRLIDVSAEEFMVAYNKKASLNFHRANNGAVDGTYDKSKETPLYVELLPPCDKWLAMWGTQNG